MSGRIAPYHGMMAAFWRPPSDPSIHADAGADATQLLRFQQAVADAGHRVTITSIVAKAVAHAIATVPEANVVWRRGRWHPRQDVRVFVYATDEEGRVGGRPLHAADELDLLRVQELLDRLNRRLAGTPTRGMQRFYAKAQRWPHGLARRAVDVLSRIVHNTGLYGRRGLDRDGFGAVGITNVGSIGIALPPAIPSPPMARHVILLSIGMVADRPVAIEGEVVVRPWLPITANLDHRAFVGIVAKRTLDAFHTGLQDPQVLRSFLPEPLRQQVAR